jgi:hypothetical protein
MTFTSMDLTDQHRLAGTITAITTQQTKGSKPIPGSKDLMLQVDSNDTEYLIYRSSQDYADVLSNVKVGNKATIYYGEHREAYNDFIAYQLEINNRVIYSKDEYEKRERSAGRFVAIQAGLIMLTLVLYQIRNRYKAKNSLRLSAKI